MKTLREISRFLLGIIFLISGFVKIVDPIGTAIKMEEYFLVFADNFSSVFVLLIPHAMLFSVAVIVLELVLGFTILFLIEIKTTAWLYLLIISYFTILTYYSASTGEVTDCGCFGDAMPLTPWQSFSKDIFLFIFVIIFFSQRNKFTPIFTTKIRYILLLSFTLACVFFAKHNVDHLPVIDFRQYAIGNNITELMKDGKPGIYHYIMEKDGEEKEWEIWPEEEGWNYKEMVTIKEPKLPTINDFILSDKNGEEGQAEILKGKQLIIVSQKLAYFKNEQVDAIQKLINSVKYNTSLITGSGFEKYDEFNLNAKFNLPVYVIDEVVIKAMIRSNPGLILIEDGVVKAKWHFNDFPKSTKEIEAYL